MRIQPKIVLNWRRKIKIDHEPCNEILFGYLFAVAAPENKKLNSKTFWLHLETLHYLSRVLGERI